MVSHSRVQSCHEHGAGSCLQYRLYTFKVQTHTLMSKKCTCVCASVHFLIMLWHHQAVVFLFSDADNYQRWEQSKWKGLFPFSTSSHDASTHTVTHASNFPLLSAEKKPTCSPETNISSLPSNVYWFQLRCPSFILRISDSKWGNPTLNRLSSRRK